jgi:hypothetical protein
MPFQQHPVTPSSRAIPLRPGGQKMVDRSTITVLPRPVFRREIVNSLSPFHRATLEVLEEKGEVVITEDKPGES